MGKPPEGGGTLLTISTCILALCLIPAGGQINQEYGCPSQEKILPCRCSTREMEFQIWCSHSELPSVLEGLKAVSHYVTRPVDELILENNNLPSLPGKVLASLRVLRLMLRNNRLERVSSGWLEGLDDSLLELFIVEPDLRSLPTDSLENLQGLEAVTLQSKTIKRLPRFSGLAKLRYLQVNSPSLLELSPMNNRELPNLEQFNVFGSPQLSRLEAGLFRNLPRLALVNISNSAIARIHPRAFIDLPMLREISLNDNGIVDASIVGRAIVDLPSLSVLSLDGNRIVRLSEASFVDNPSLGRLSIARNRIEIIEAGAFQRLSGLRVLDLSHNRVRRVSAEFFLQPSGSSRLEEMWIIDNRLRHVNELRAILEALPALKFLDASYNLLEEIPYGALGGHPTIERLHLDHNRLSFLQRDSFVAMPALRELRLRNNSLTNLAEAPFWNLPGLKGLDLSENYFRHLEPRLLANLPNLRRLDVSGNGIGLVEPETFVGTSALEHLNLSGNALSIIHPLTLGRLTSLYELDVGWNRLLEIVPGLPRNIEHLHLPMNRIVSLPRIETRDLSLPRLRSLDLSANGIEIILPGTLSELPNLRKFNLGYNALRLLDDGTFDGLSRLEQLDIRYNALVSLHGRSLVSLVSLMDLNIRGNRLEIIRPDLFKENLQLQRLDVSRNNLAQIPHATFTSTRDLRELYASHNTLTELPSSLHGLKALEVLDLSFNKLNILSPETLSSLTSLLELKLVRNRIKELREGAFDRLPRLSLIDLESNDLRIIERNAVRSLPELQALRLGKNRLRSIPSGAFSELPLLQSAELQNNRIYEIAKNAFVNVPHLLFLNLSDNQLPEISHVGLESLRSLEVLDLSNNRLSRVSSDSLAAMEWLVELKMDNNRICSIKGSPFDDMPRLRVLSLRSNRMTTVTEKAFKRLRSNIAILDIDGNPLSCSCSMLWLRGWLQETSADGPRCADGSLFKKMRLSRQDCQRKRQFAPPDVYPGCEAEMLDHSPSSVSSTLYSADTPEDLRDWMNLKDSSDHRASQNMDYMDYLVYDDYGNNRDVNTSKTSTINKRPFDESTTEVSSSTSPRQSTPELVSPSSPTTSLAPPNVVVNSPSPEHPSRHKNSPIPPSPSSSGFTFFGVPLPSINFNLWGNTGSRKSQRKEDNGVLGSGHGNGAARTNRPGRGRYRVFPPTEPEIHRGGFVPLPRAQGGFVPIPDPRLSYERKIPKRNASAKYTNNRTATVTRVYQITPPGKRRNLTHDLTNNTRMGNLPLVKMPSTREGEHATTLPRATQNGEEAPPMTIASTTTNNSVLSAKLTGKVQENNESIETYVEPTAAITNRVIWTASPSSMEIAKIDNFTRDNDPPINDDTAGTKKIDIWDIEARLPSGEGILAESIEEEEDDDDPTQASTIVTSVDYRLSVSEESSTSHYRPLVVEPVQDTNTTGLPRNAEILEEASALSALLIPGGQLLASSSSRPPSGRSTIVKVASPHLLSLTADRHYKDNNDTLDTTDYRIDSTTRENHRSTDIDDPSKISIDESVKIIEDSNFNWYFRNYNESNIEPYVGVVYNSGVRKNYSSRLAIFVIVNFFLAHASFRKI